MGGEAAPCIASGKLNPQVLRLLRSRSGINPLATKVILTTVLLLAFGVFADFVFAQFVGNRRVRNPKPLTQLPTARVL